MSPFEIDFEKVLELFESQGWKLQKIWGNYRVFLKPGELPWLIPVQNGKVHIEYYKKVKKFFEGQDEGE